MRIIIVHIGDIALYPPVLSLINALEYMEIETLLLTTKLKIELPHYKYVTVKSLEFDYERKKSVLEQFIEMFRIRKMVWDYINEIYKEDDVIWVTYNVSLKHLGKKIIKKKYVVQLMELMDSLSYHHKFPIIRMDAKKICNNALAVVVPEYNRAHIQKAYWELTELPKILPNKPYLAIDIDKKANINDVDAKRTIEKIKDRKIILYQGALNRERPLDKFINAVNKLGDEYAFVVMSGGEDIYSNYPSDNYFFIPYVEAPKHLEITSHAYIGVLSYAVEKNSIFSPLNVLYCAPNKVFEYSLFGVPMIGNDLPGLKYLFETTDSGVVCTENDEQSIINAILKIDCSYDEYSTNSKKFYDSVNYEEQLTDILKVCKNKMKKGI